MSDHADIERMLAVYGSLDGPQRRTADAHVAACPRCAATHASYRAMDRGMAMLVDPRPRLSPAEVRAAALRGRLPVKPAVQPCATLHISDRQAWAGRARPALLPAGLILLMIAAALLLMRLSAPLNPGVAETPSVTPSATPAVMASPDLAASAAAGPPERREPVQSARPVTGDSPVSRGGAATLTPVAVSIARLPAAPSCCAARQACFGLPCSP